MYFYTIRKVMEARDEVQKKNIRAREISVKKNYARQVNLKNIHALV